MYQYKVKGDILREKKKNSMYVGNFINYCNTPYASATIFRSN